jgi:diguanylate cyclase (GGDEF)-like protein
LTFGNINLKKRVDEYLALAKQLMKVKTQEEALPILDHLLLLSNPLLVDLNGAVLQYQKEGEENIANIRHLESLAWIVTLFTLLMEVIFIFQPMANAIKLFIQNERSHNERLEQEIKIRTYSLEQANQKLSYSASHDPLTGLYNRVKVEETFLYEQKQSIRYGDPLSIILMDLDFFKSVNDVYGHNAGDIFLQEVAEILRDTFRSTDVIGRWGGEEFLIVLPKTDLTSAHEIAIKLRDRMQETKFTNIGTRTSSCGVATLREDESLVNVIQRADSALYLAKDNGRNRVEVANS